MNSAKTNSSLGLASELVCRPCRRNWQAVELTNPRRCPQCGGPTTTAAQIERYNEATSDALKSLCLRSAGIMRMTSLSMVSVQIMTYFFQDRQAADFFNDIVTTASAVATIATEVWAFTRSRMWMVVASLCIQIAAILFFFVAVAFLSNFIPARLALLIGVLPLAGSLAAWHQFRAYSQLLRLHRKAR